MTSDGNGGGLVSGAIIGAILTAMAIHSVSSKDQTRYENSANIAVVTDINRNNGPYLVLTSENKAPQIFVYNPKSGKYVTMKQYGEAQKDRIAVEALSGRPSNNSTLTNIVQNTQSEVGGRQ